MIYSRRTILYGCALIISASFTRQLMNFTKAIIGLYGFKLIISLVMFSTAALFITFLLKKRIKFTRTVLILILLFVGLGTGFSLAIPEERMHLVLYGMLGISAADDLKKKSKIHAFLMTVIFVVISGVAEELFQGLLPYRVCQLSDMALNIIFGVWGAGLYILTGKSG